jgi:hypothetical protein
VIGDVELDNVGVTSGPISARNVFRRSTRRPASATPAPALASVRANCAPRPLEAPVTSATRPEIDIAAHPLAPDKGAGT